MHTAVYSRMLNDSTHTEYVVHSVQFCMSLSATQRNMLEPEELEVNIRPGGTVGNRKLLRV